VPVPRARTIMSRAHYVLAGCLRGNGGRFAAVYTRDNRP
jgi:hypothetical protein